MARRYYYPRWEVVRTDDGWHSRFRASNGALLMSSEVYPRRRNAVRVIEVVAMGPVYEGRPAYGPETWTAYTYATGESWVGEVEVRYIDERATS